MLKTSSELAVALPATGIDNSKVVGSGNNGKLAKSNFTKPVRKAEEPKFLTPDARQAFTQLRQAFIKALILQHFDPKRHIRIKTDPYSYAIDDIHSQITLEMGQWYPITYYF